MLETQTSHRYEINLDKPFNKWALWLPILITAVYPLLLNAFHAVVMNDSGQAPAPVSASMFMTALMLMLAVFAVPAMGLVMALRSHGRSRDRALELRVRRLGLFIIAAPTLYCFVGVNLLMLGSPVADEWAWAGLWLVTGLYLTTTRAGDPSFRPVVKRMPALRVAHGIAGVIVLLFVAFHLFNHLFGLFGPETHLAVMEVGRAVYRSPFVEPILVLALLFQVASGVWLAWNWSAHGADKYRIVQIGSGVFLAVFILGHLNAVFIFARTVLGIETGWEFASGDPVGMIHDPWGIRLLPHYAIGVMFVIVHLFSGLRVVMLGHGVSRSLANRCWWGGVVIGSLVSLLIMLGITGVRLG